MDSSRLQKFTSQGGKLVDDPCGVQVLHVQSPHLLLQVAGYLKHVESKTKPISVLFRGQAKMYASLMPGLYRGVSTNTAKASRDHKLKTYLNEIEVGQAVLRAVDPRVREGLLQHYGIRTRYLDVVDNVWVALWFACHNAIGSGKRKDYLHFEKRRVRRSTASEFAYVLLVRAGASQADDFRPGVFEGEGTELIDLRVAAPSHFLRPHAQHGLVVRRAKHNDHTRMDCKDLVVGVIRVDLDDALDWLGSGALVQIHGLFPPPAYDLGYAELLEKCPDPPVMLGGIHKVGA
jgi:hypothetical protein